jgi:hypothetical protein
MPEAFAPPMGPPPRHPAHSNSLDVPNDDPPPAYTPSAGIQGDQHLEAGPTHLALSRPPPEPSRLDGHITGVGEGFGPRSQHTGNAWSGGNPFGDQNQLSNGSAPPPLPARMSSNNIGSAQAGSSSGSSGQDTSPSEVPTPGRPLLHHGQLLVYPKNHFCAKCGLLSRSRVNADLVLGGNTGYKSNDPSNPHISVCNHR